MKSLLLSSFIFLLSFFAAAQDVPVNLVVPNALATVPGTATFTGPLGNTARTYQMLIHENQLTTLVGKELKGITWRLNTSATTNWPATETIYTNYDIYLSGSVAPVDRSLTFVQNIVGVQKTVRFGQLTIPVDAFTFGNSPNNFGPVIAFDTAYLYTGGHLLIELHLSTSTGTARSIEALGTSGSGYGSDVSACWTGSYTGGTGTGAQGNFTVVQITSDLPTPVELTSFTAAVTGKDVQLRWSTASETNNKGFEVQRKTNDQWESIVFIEGAGTTTEKKNYSFKDANLIPDQYTYRLKQVDYDGSYEYSKEVLVSGITAVDFALENCYPNPANPGTMISYSIPSESYVSLNVFNLLGQSVRQLVNDKQSAGSYKFSFDGTGLTSGMYLYTINAVSTSGNAYTATKKFLLLK